MISIIMPIYNMEEHMEKAIDSVMNQTNQDFELILVDDGSTDNSLVMCKSYENKHQQIKVVTKENGGLSSARNAGISIAQGEYIQFIDPDDYIEKDLVENSYRIISANDVDLVITGMRKVLINDYDYKKDIVCENQSVGLYKNERFLADFVYFYSKLLLNSTCNKIYKKEIILNNNIESEIGLNRGQDLVFNLEYFKYSNSIYISNYIGYNYVSYGDVMQTATTKFKKDLLDNQEYLFSKVREFLIESNVYSGRNVNDFENIYITNLIGCIDNYFSTSSILTNHEILSILEIVQNSIIGKSGVIHYKPNSINQKIVYFLLINNRIKLSYFYFKFKLYIKSKLL